MSLRRRRGSGTMCVVETLEQRRLLSALPLGRGAALDRAPVAGPRTPPINVAPPATGSLGNVRPGMPVQYSMGQLSENNRVSTYRFTVTQATQVRLELNDPSKLAVMGIYTPSGQGVKNAWGRTISISLNPGTYHLRVIQQNDGSHHGTHPYVVTTSAASLAAPTRAQAVAWGGNSAQVRWIDNAKDELGYRIEHFDPKTRTWSKVAVAGRNHTAAAVTGLEPGRQHWFRVSAVGKNGTKYEAIAAPFVTSAMTASESTDGYYKVTGLTYHGKGEASWSAQENLAIQSAFQDKWFAASSWQDAVGQAVAGSATITKDDNSTTNAVFATAGYFRIDIGEDVKSIGGNDLSVSNDAKVIALEDSYGTIDEDYDDFFWTVEVQEKADLVIDGLPEETEPAPNELTPGAMLAINDDDDDADDDADLDQPGAVSGEDDLVAMELRLPPSLRSAYSGDVTLSIISGSSFVNVWSGADRSGGLILGGALTSETWTIGEHPTTVWVEGLAKGIATFELVATPASQPASQPAPAPDSASANVGAYDLDVLKIEHNDAGEALADEDEMRTGAFVPVNTDDDDYSIAQGNSSGSDRDQQGAVDGEDDLLPIVLRGVDNAGGQVRLKFDSGKIKLFQQPDRTEPITSGAVMATPEQDVTIYAEGVTAGRTVIRLADVGNNRNVDFVSVHVFPWQGPLNVPQFGTYRYIMSAAIAGSKWLAPAAADGTIVEGADTRDVKIKWAAGPRVAKAVFQASDDYIWDLGVNVVEVKVEAPDEGETFTEGEPEDGGNVNGRKIVKSDAQAGLAWQAKVTFNGPAGNRGVAQMKAGFAQNVDVTKFRGSYDGETNGQPHRLRSEMEGKRFFDSVLGADYPYYSSAPGAVFFDPSVPARTKTIESSDKPEAALPLLWDNQLANSHLNAVEVDWNFDLYVLASTTDTRNNAHEVYPAQAQAEWRFNGSGAVGNAPQYVWTPGNGAGVTHANAWGAVTEVPKLDGVRANAEAAKNVWIKIEN